MNISLEDWKQKFLPIELGPDYQPRASQCSMFEVTENEIPKFLSGEFPGNQSENLKKIDCRSNGGWTYDQRYLLPYITLKGCENFNWTLFRLKSP